MQEERDAYIDFLRCVGLLLIVLAHVHAPVTIHQIRCFDVPLMVFVSGLSYSKKNLPFSWIGFMWPRIKRLVIPIYIFIIVDVIAFSLLREPFSLNVILRSFFLCVDGAIGYVWIIKVFLLMMLITPLLLLIQRKNNIFLLIFIILAYILQIILTNVPATLHGVSETIFAETVPYLIGYSIFYAWGMALRYSSQLLRIVLMITILLVFGLTAGQLLQENSQLLITPFYKYPPRSIFILYGLLMTSLLWVIRAFLLVHIDRKLFTYIGENTIWIYI